MFDFNKLITPKILFALYILTMVLFLIAAIFALFNGEILGAIGLIISAVFSRIFFECIMIAFKNNEYLRRIAESVDKPQAN